MSSVSKIVANSQKSVLNPTNVYKCIVEQLMALPNEEKQSFVLSMRCHLTQNI